MPARRDVVLRVVERLPTPIDLTEAEQTWFCDVRKQGGWRLTAKGFHALQTAKLDYWQIPFDIKQINKKVVLEMHRKITWPYYLSAKPPSLILFHSNDAVMASLYGNVIAWVQSVSCNPNCHDEL